MTQQPQIYKALYDVITSWTEKDGNKYTAFYPFQENPINIKDGYISFFKLPQRTVVSRSESLDNQGVLTVSITETAEIQIDIIRYIDYADEANNSDNVALRLKTWLATRQAWELFSDYGLDLCHVWQDLMTDGSYTDKKKWAQRSFFRVKFYYESKVTSEDTPLENIEIETKSI